MPICKATYAVIVTVDPLLPKIVEALDVYDISATRFGYVVAGDPALVKKMREGRRPRRKMRGKIEKALSKLERKGTL